MNKGLSTGLFFIGIIIIALAALNHWVLKISVMPHFNPILGVVGLVVAAIGAWGALRGSQSA